jgi:hypothetical protein
MRFREGAKGHQETDERRKLRTDQGRCETNQCHLIARPSSDENTIDTAFPALSRAGFGGDPDIGLRRGCLTVDVDGERGRVRCGVITLCWCARLTRLPRVHGRVALSAQGRGRGLAIVGSLGGGARCQGEALRPHRRQAAAWSDVRGPRRRPRPRGRAAPGPWRTLCAWFPLLRACSLDASTICVGVAPAPERRAHGDGTVQR